MRVWPLCLALARVFFERMAKEHTPSQRTQYGTKPMTSKTPFFVVLLALVSVVTAADKPELFGIGIALIAGDPIKGPQIYSIVPNSPAAKAKLSKGFIVSTIDGTPTAGTRLIDCVNMIRGADGTTVQIEATDPKNGTTTQVDLIREKLDLSK